MLLGLVGVGYCLVHLNQIGLPGFIKGPLLEQLRARGLNLEFSRLRVRIGRGLVAEHVTVEHPGERAGELFFAEELQLKLGWAPLWNFSIPEIQSLRIRNGEVTIPIPAEPGAPPYLFRVNQVMGRVVFLSAEEWELQSLEAACHGGRFRAFGSFTNASILRRVRNPKQPISDAWKKPLLEFGRALDRARFADPPLLSVAFHADLRFPERATADIELRAPGMTLKAGTFSGVILSAGLNQPPGTNGSLPVTLRVEATRAVTRWGECSNFVLNASSELSPSNAIPDQLEWSFRTDGILSPWVTVMNLVARGDTLRTNGSFASTLQLTGTRALSVQPQLLGDADHLKLELKIHHSLSNWNSGSVQLFARNLHSQTVEAESIYLQLGAVQRTNRPITELNLLRWLSTVSFEGTTEVSNILGHDLVRNRSFSAKRIATDISWTGDQFRFKNLNAELPTGSLSCLGSLDVLTRHTEVEFQGAVDLHAYETLLTPAAQHWLGQYGWSSNRPPQIQGSLALTWSAWTNRYPDWRGEVLPTLTLAGHVNGGPFSFRGISGDQAQGDFNYTNHIWRVAKMTATRGEGEVAFAYEGDEISHAYHFRLKSTLDPKIIRPLLEPERQRQVLDEFEFTSPPKIVGDVWGEWKAREKTGFELQIATTNFVFRGEAIEAINGRVAYTNAMVVFTDAYLRSAGEAHVPGGAYDAVHHRLSFTNTTTTLAPQRVARVIGPKSSQVMSNYVFTVPPATTIQGVISTAKNPADTDIIFSAIVPDFKWWRIGLTNASARLHFRGETLALTDLDAGSYGGRTRGSLFFDWTNKGDTQIRANLQTTNVNLAGVMHTLVSPTNRLEGVLHGNVRMTGHTSDTNSWAGNGDATLRDGFLWDLPLFGIFSKLFDAILPGTGQTRFKAGQMSFVVTNSVLSTRDMEVRSAAMRLGYRGKVALNTQLDARMEAELFRDAPLIGPLLNFALTPFTKLFEYDVKGTLRKPKAEPRYVPKFLLAPLRPLKTLRELLAKDVSPEIKGPIRPVEVLPSPPVP